MCAGFLDVRPLFSDGIAPPFCQNGKRFADSADIQSQRAASPATAISLTLKKDDPIAAQL
ncbi:MAG: hypothetical protein ABI583_01615 [Betaproteobacteria bacterium]